MQVRLSLVALLASLLFLPACGYVDRAVVGVSGNATKTCVDGVTYLQFTSGATVQLDINNKVVACK